MHKAEEYTISVRLETIEDENYYVSRVAELPDVEEYADTREEAISLALDTVRTTQRVFAEEGREFPAPMSFNEQPLATGRVTLRLRKGTHQQAIENSKLEGVSLNSYLCAKIESNIHKPDYSKILNQLEQLTEQVRELSNQMQRQPEHHGSRRLTTALHVGSQQKFNIHSKLRLTDSDNFNNESNLSKVAFYPGFFSGMECS
ncbi:TPA: hypothetical protein MIM87_11055 [Klebsiella variicola]|nr:hypothetical protein [Klebsiella pneumoniae]HBX9997647.1 hypothetical protein [Klebsiella variicola]